MNVKQTALNRFLVNLVATAVLAALTKYLTTVPVTVVGYGGLVFSLLHAVQDWLNVNIPNL